MHCLTRKSHAYCQNLIHERFKVRPNIDRQVSPKSGCSPGCCKDPSTQNPHCKTHRIPKICSPETPHTACCASRQSCKSVGQ
jgi:hypothetical protein